VELLSKKNPYENDLVERVWREQQEWKMETKKYIPELRKGHDHH